MAIQETTTHPLSIFEFNPLSEQSMYRISLFAVALIATFLVIYGASSLGKCDVWQIGHEMGLPIDMTQSLLPLITGSVALITSIFFLIYDLKEAPPTIQIPASSPAPTEVHAIETNAPVPDPFTQSMPAVKDIAINTSTPGKCMRILVAVGDLVEKGSPLYVLECMKMEMTIGAPCKGKVKAIHIGPLTVVQSDQLVLTLSSSET